MPSDSSKTKSKRGSSKNAEIDEMALAVNGNDFSFSRNLAQEVMLLGRPPSNISFTERVFAE